ncbi:hypothetical protein KJ641_04605 [Patescibacteria group bacterium]|nr:hypothetical protein [Patescibacteria group bacterium]MBU1896116.1 hypothetical protein [Patescibacteria group bacterium]
MLQIQMISGELSPYYCHGGLGIAVENLSAQLVSLGVVTEVFFPYSERISLAHTGRCGLTPTPVRVSLDVMSQLDCDLAPNLALFCQKSVNSLSSESKCFVAHDNESAVSMVIGRKAMDVPSVFWLHSLYDHPLRMHFPPEVRRLLTSESLLASAIRGSQLLVTSSGLLNDALSVVWPHRLREAQFAIYEASVAGKVVTVESLGLLKERCVSCGGTNVLSRLGLDRSPFVLFPSRPVISKGIGFFQSIAEKMRDSNLTFVSVGNPSDEVRSICTNISWIPWLEKDELFELMTKAKAVLYPSLTEGYGLAAAESAKFNDNVFCHPVGGLQVLIQRRLVNEISLSEEELQRLYHLWGDLLSAENSTEVCAIWSTQSMDFANVIEQWVSSISYKLSEKGCVSTKEPRLGEKSWQCPSWGEVLIRAIERF